MELIILGKEHDANTEIEVFAKNQDLGFNVECQLLTGGSITYQNVTEFHHLWDRSAYPNGTDLKDRIACESDIHGTGSVPWTIFEKYSKIEVKNAERIHSSFQKITQ